MNTPVFDDAWRGDTICLIVGSSKNIFHFLGVEYKILSLAGKCNMFF